jgi:hypothetical protein
MAAAPTLAKRRALAVKLAPMISEMDRKIREHGRATGAGDELSDLRADKLFLLALRGFEVPCQWSFEQCHEYLGG